MKKTVKNNINNNIVMLSVLLFLALLFVVSFQPIITGHVVFDWKKITLSDYPFPFIKNNYYNDVYIVLGNQHTAQETFAANDIAYGLKGLRATLPPIILESEVPKTAHNLILVGTPSTNSMVADFVGTDDSSALNDGGVVMLDNKERSATLLVTGQTDEDVRKAGLFLRYYALYMPLGKIAYVHGSISNPNGFVVNYKQ